MKSGALPGSSLVDRGAWSHIYSPNDFCRSYLVKVMELYLGMDDSPQKEEYRKKDLKELARLFSKLGITAFGGPAAHIAMMQREVVDRLGWMDHQHFLDLIGATNLIPGPNSTEMAIHIGYERGGWKGLLIAGCCFILPAVIITGF